MLKKAAAMTTEMSIYFLCFITLNTKKLASLKMVSKNINTNNELVRTLSLRDHS